MSSSIPAAMQSHFYAIDWVVLGGYFAGMLALGFSFSRQNRSAEQFTVGGRSLPGWLCGLSIFATYLSSISYLALPGKSFAGNWNPFVFSLAIPPATWIAVRWFMPYYRASGEVSAYALLEHRFGAWARVYASSFYLLFQVARSAVVLYLMALPMSVIFGWDMRTIIIATGVVVILYSFVGGVVAVIWSDAIQAIVLMAGAVFALVVMLLRMPAAAGAPLATAFDEGKFSLGSWDLANVSQSTVWVVLAYGFIENLKNFGIDQSYVQRYIASKNDREARKSLWLGGLLYVPMSALFFLIGTTLWAFYHGSPGDLDEVRLVVARQRLTQQGVGPRFEVAADGSQQWTADYRSQIEEAAAGLTESDLGDRVFPHFIAKYLPPGATGLLIAAVFAAAMSTISTSLNSSATLVMSDFYLRFIAPDASDRQQLAVLRGATIAWGAFGTAGALALIRLTESALDVWWTLSSVLSGGIVGLFLLGLISRRAGNRASLTGVLTGMAAIGWMIVSQTNYWPESLAGVRSPFHNFMITVVGTATILLTGLVLTRFASSDSPTDSR